MSTLWVMGVTKQIEKFLAPSLQSGVIRICLPLSAIITSALFSINLKQPQALAHEFNIQPYPVLLTQNDRGIQQIRPEQKESEIRPRRVALLIGNSNYKASPLRNPSNDAKDMGQVLEDLNFDRVILVLDANLQEMDSAVNEFYTELGRGSVGVFYYAGHGIQSQGENYLIPVDAEIALETDLRYKALPLGLVLNRIDDASNDVSIVILDACRNNPFSRSWRSSASGLATVDAPKGVFIAYATAPGSVAGDGEGRNGTFTQALLKYIRTPGLTVEELFKDVRVEVQSVTRERQIPWDSSSLTGDFSFSPEPISPGIASTSPPVVNPVVAPPVSSPSTPIGSSTPSSRPSDRFSSPDTSNVTVTPSVSPSTPSSAISRPTPPRVDQTPIDSSLSVLEANPTQDLESMYARLEAFARAGEWRKADEQNYWLLSQLAEQGSRGNQDYRSMSLDEVSNISCVELQNIDRIWTEESKGNFGYSVQLRQISSVGETPQSVYDSVWMTEDYKAWNKLSIAVGWGTGTEQNINYYSSVSYTINSNRGHLPDYRWGQKPYLELLLHAFQCRL